MTKLVLSAASSKLLRRIAGETSSDDDAVQQLKAELLGQPGSKKMTEQSPAVPSTEIDNKPPERIVVSHTVLISIASWAIRNSVTPDSTALKLSNLVKGSSVYIPPKPTFKRSKELEDSLAAIRRAQEEAEYARISSSTPNTSSYRIPSSYVNIAGVDPTLPLSQRFSSSSNTSTSLMGRKEEEEAWKDAQRTLSVILNIFLSTLATATAAWWASGNASAQSKVMASGAVGLITALAEVVLYNRYYVYVKESGKIKKGRMKGSDLKSHSSDFKPLQLGKGAPLPAPSPVSAEKEPS